jgi:hypothetical protein
MHPAARRPRPVSSGKYLHASNILGFIVMAAGAQIFSPPILEPSSTQRCEGGCALSERK